jgi:anti-anti-sigma factor
LTATSFAAKSTVEDGVQVVELSGEFDNSNAGELKKHVEQAVSEGRPLLIDLARCTFIDSAGLAALVAAQRRLTEASGSFAVCCPAPQVTRLLELTGTDEPLGVVDNRGAGLAALGV